jgi:hypothetical protein
MGIRRDCKPSPSRYRSRTDIFQLPGTIQQAHYVTLVVESEGSSRSKSAAECSCGTSCFAIRSVLMVHGSDTKPVAYSNSKSASSIIKGRHAIDQEEKTALGLDPTARVDSLLPAPIVLSSTFATAGPLTTAPSGRTTLDASRLAAVEDDEHDTESVCGPMILSYGSHYVLKSDNVIRFTVLLFTGIEGFAELLSSPALTPSLMPPRAGTSKSSRSSGTCLIG